MSKNSHKIKVTLLGPDGNEVITYRTDNPVKIGFILSVMREGDIKGQEVRFLHELGKTLDDSALRVLTAKHFTIPSEKEVIEAGARAWANIVEYKESTGEDFNMRTESVAHRAGWMGCFRWIIGLMKHGDKGNA